jgi:4-hydroxythreonine-4-phosphate dehydrogenase
MKLLAVTPGEPAGIGPECLLRLHAQRPELPLLAVADPQLLTRTARDLGLDTRIESWSPGVGAENPQARPGTLWCHPVTLAAPASTGTLNVLNAPYVLETIRTAVGLVQSGEAAALVTGPIHKGIICESGAHFTGHTEFLAALAKVPRVVMMLAAGTFRVALVTTHLPLSKVPAAITAESVSETLRITLEALQQQWGIARPRIQVLGLNPHAGEGGHLGHEDDEIIAPAMTPFIEAGHALLGPVPADAAFTPSALQNCDAVVAMYHDQGLPVLKHAGFGRAVNITLGLPFIRTSVDHGTALDIAGRGLANPDSLGHAVDQALLMLDGPLPGTPS